MVKTPARSMEEWGFESPVGPYFFTMVLLVFPQKVIEFKYTGTFLRLEGYVTGEFDRRVVD